MRKKDNNPKRTRRLPSAKGVAVLMAIFIAGLWIYDQVGRSVRSNQETDPRKGIVIEGNFAGEGKKVPAETTAPVADPITETQIAEFSPIQTGIPDNCVPIPQDQTALHSGKLLCLDSEHWYSGYEGSLVDFSEHNDSYSVRFSELEAQPCVVDAMNKMALAYETAADNGKLMVYSTNEAVNSDGSLYPEELPDRATGYCVDLGVLNDDETISPIYETNTWLENNAYLYGFVLSYPASDEELTGIPGAPYHLRYVGRVHANIMHQEGLTLSRYLKEIKRHETGNPYIFHGGMQNYSVYYVPEGDFATTDVPVPLGGDYEISGNNIDGFIVAAQGTLK